MRSIWASIALIPILCACHTYGEAWNAAGHRMVAAIAYNDLDEAVVAFLTPHIVGSRGRKAGSENFPAGCRTCRGTGVTVSLLY